MFSNIVAKMMCFGLTDCPKMKSSVDVDVDVDVDADADVDGLLLY